MIDEQQAPDLEVEEPQDGPPEGATPVDDGGQQVDWEKRFKDTQSEYTRQQQWASQLPQQLSNPATASHALQQLGLSPEQIVEALGYQVAQNEEEQQEPDEFEFRDPRFDQFLEHYQEQEFQRQAQDLQQQVEGEISRHATEKELQLSDRELTNVFRDVMDLAGEQGLQGPQVLAAVGTAIESFASERKAYEDGVIARYRDSKRPTNQAPPKGGSAGVPATPSDAKGRLDLANQIAEEAYQSQS